MRFLDQAPCFKLIHVGSIKGLLGLLHGHLTASLWELVNEPLKGF